MIRRLLVHTSLFLAVFSGMAFLLSNLGIKGRPLWAYLNASLVLRGGQTFRMSKELVAFPADSSTYLVLGSSHAYKGYDPKAFMQQGISVFNAGTAGQTLPCSFELLKYYNNKFKKVILDLYPGSFSYSAGESQLILLQSISDIGLVWKLFLIKVNIHTVNNLLYRLLRLNSASMYLENTYEGRGYVSSREEMPDQFIPAPDNLYKMDQFDLLKTMIGYCREKKIDLTLVSHPLPVPDEDDPGYRVFEGEMAGICRSQNITFYNYMYAYDLDSTCFQDLNHLNAKGVAFFNKEFIRDRFKKDGTH